MWHSCLRGKLGNCSYVATFVVVKKIVIYTYVLSCFFYWFCTPFCTITTQFSLKGFTVTFCCVIALECVCYLFQDFCFLLVLSLPYDYYLYYCPRELRVFIDLGTAYNSLDIRVDKLPSINPVGGLYG